MAKLPTMLFARPNGEWLDFPPLSMLGMSGNCLLLPSKKDLIPLPEGATLTMMPQAAPYGFDAERGSFLLLEENPYLKKAEPIYALAALLPQGFSRTLLPAAQPVGPPLPLLGYTAVGVDEKGRLVCAARQTDEHQRWHPRHYNSEDLAARVEKRCQACPQNRILQQLGRCSLEYGCFTAQNIFYQRWEGGIPVSPACNAACLGCISLQESECCPSPQSRIRQAPSVAEIVEVALPHLRAAKDAIISFGQGCEGEPSLEYERIAAAIREIRAQTQSGTLNINTNAGNPLAIETLCQAGMDSFRVSLFSPIAADYAAYHRPHGYDLESVKQSLSIIRRYGKKAALNLLAYPGYTDRPHFLEALVALCRETGLQQIQLRNLNIDPRVMAPFCGEGCGMGLANMLALLKTELPGLEIGNYSRPVRQES